MACRCVGKGNHYESCRPDTSANANEDRKSGVDEAAMANGRSDKVADTSARGK
ncbi:MAG: hypothetical protein IJS63_09600 [Bacteroidaceae bacterium]|nr:hypothetical protein [Bacteroidaceae bacterium]